MVSRNFLPSRAAQEESYLQSLYDKGFLFLLWKAIIGSKIWICAIWPLNCSVPWNHQWKSWRLLRPRPRLMPRLRPRPRPKWRLSHQPPQPSHKRGQSLLKFPSMTNNFSIPFWPGLRTQRLNPSGPFTKGWPGMIQRRKSLLPNGS